MQVIYYFERSRCGRPSNATRNAQNALKLAGRMGRWLSLHNRPRAPINTLRDTRLTCD